MAEDEKKLVHGVSFPELVKKARELEGMPARAPGPDTANYKFGDGDGVAIFLPKYRDMSYSEILTEIAKVEKVRVMSAALGYPGVKEGQLKAEAPEPVVFPIRQKDESEAPGGGNGKTAPVSGGWGDYAERTAKPEPVMFRRDAERNMPKQDKPQSSENPWQRAAEPKPSGEQGIPRAEIPKTAPGIELASRGDTGREREEISKLRVASPSSREQEESLVSRQIAEMIKKESPDLRTKEITGRANERLLPEAPKRQSSSLFSISERAVKEPDKAGPAPEEPKPRATMPPAIEIRPPKVVVRKEPEPSARANESTVGGALAGGREAVGGVAGIGKGLDGLDAGWRGSGKTGGEPKAREEPLSAQDSSAGSGKPGLFQGIAGLLRAGAKKDASARKEAGFSGTREKESKTSRETADGGPVGAPGDSSRRKNEDSSEEELKQLEKIGAYWKEQGERKKDDPMERLKQYRKKRREEWDEK